MIFKRKVSTISFFYHSINMKWQTDCERSSSGYFKCIQIVKLYIYFNNIKLFHFLNNKFVEDLNAKIHSVEVVFWWKNHCKSFN